MCVYKPIQGRSNPENVHQNSNIVEFVGLLRKDDPSKQMVYYHVCHTLHTLKAKAVTTISHDSRASGRSLRLSTPTGALVPMLARSIGSYN